MTNRVWRVLISAGILAAGVGVDQATDLVAPGLSIWASVLVAALVQVVGEVVAHRARLTLHDDPKPPDLPALPEWLVGRPDEIEKIVRAVLAGRAAAVGITTGLHGAGGFGKTTLAYVVAHDRAVRRYFRNRVYVVTVGQDVRGPEAIARLVNEAVEKITGTLPTSTNPRNAADRLAQVLDKRGRILLVIDDVWHRDQLEPFLQGGKNCVRLVT